MSIRTAGEKEPHSFEAQPRAVGADSVESWRLSASADVLQLAPTPIHPKWSGKLRLIGWLAGALTIAAILSSAVLLLSDARPWLASLFRSLIVLAPKAWAWLGHAPLSALPLLLAGASYVILQAVLRPSPMELLRRLMLGSAFLLWGIVQLMPSGTLATDLGDVVITLYVIDLGLMVQAELHRD